MEQPNEDWWRKLEEERNDLSYLAHPKKVSYAPTVAPMLTKKERKLWFDAGRYSAGARDAVAVKAHEGARRIAGQ